MLAPRKKLWSTPGEALELAIDLLNIRDGDVVYDIGCGDGNFLTMTAERLSSSRILLKGVEIEAERAALAEQRVRSKCSPDAEVSVLASNALEVDYSDGTCFFMYLIPRGLRLILPLLRKIPHPIRVVTFMNPFGDIPPTKELKVSSSGHAESQWPLFYYELDG
eukprot:gene12117-13770_t